MKATPRGFSWSKQGLEKYYLTEGMTEWWINRLGPGEIRHRGLVVYEQSSTNSLQQTLSHIPVLESMQCEWTITSSQGSGVQESASANGASPITSHFHSCIYTPLRSTVQETFGEIKKTINNDYLFLSLIPQMVSHVKKVIS